MQSWGMVLASAWMSEALGSCIVPAERGNEWGLFLEQFQRGLILVLTPPCSCHRALVSPVVKWDVSSCSSASRRYSSAL